MSDAKLWIDEVGCTATIAGTNVSYTMPLWAFNVMRDIIGAEAEKKVEVTHRDFDIQQELLDRHKAENAKLRESLERAAGIITDICGECPVSRYEWLSSNGCNEKCVTVTEDDCWIAYLTGKRWDEAGVEVDG